MSNSNTYFPAGTVWTKHPVGRDGKWRVSKEEWSSSIFAKKVCPGSGYLTTGDTVPKLRDAISKVL